MKKSILILFVMSLFVLSCSNEEVNDQNLNLEKNGYMTDLVQKLSDSQEFRDMFSSNALQRNNGENGIMLLNDGYNLSFLASDEDYLYLIGGLGTIEELPNGRAKFSIHTNNPSAAVLSLATFATAYSSDCIEGPLGTFNYNIISDYEVFEPIPGLVFYTPTGENASAQSANGHCNVSDAQAIVDENFEITGCTDATEFKVLRLGPSGISLE